MTADDDSDPAGMGPVDDLDLTLLQQKHPPIFRVGMLVRRKSMEGCAVTAEL